MTLAFPNYRVTAIPRPPLENFVDAQFKSFGKIHIGRPRTGKRSNEDYRNVTVYIRKQTHADADDLLRKRHRSGQIPLGMPQDVSELVEKLLSDWLSSQDEK